MVARDCWREHNEGILRRTHSRGDKLGVIIIVYQSTLTLEFAGERCCCAVVARNGIALVHEVAGNGTHANASDAEEVYVLKSLHTLIEPC